MKGTAMRLIILLLIILLATLGHARTAKAATSCWNPGFDELGPDGFPSGWGPVKTGTAEQLKNAIVGPCLDSHSGKYSLRLRAAGEGNVGANSAGGIESGITTLAGRVRFWYKAISASAEKNNLHVCIISMLPDGKEGGAPRAVFAIPKEHIGDGQWHQGEVEYNCLGGATAFMLVAPRINEGGGQTGPGEFLIDDIEVEKLPGKLKVLSFGPIHATAAAGDTIKVRAKLINTGGETLNNLALSLGLPRGMSLNGGERTLELEKLAPRETAVLEWDARADTSGIHALTLREEGQSPAAEVSTTSLAVGFSAPSLPSRDQMKPGEQSLVLGNEKLHLAFFRNDAGFGLYHVYSGQKLMAVSSPFGRLIVQTAKGPEEFRISPARYEAKNEPRRNTLMFRDTITDSDGTRWDFEADFAIKEGEKLAEVTYRIAPDRPSKLLRFDGPSLLAGEGSFGARKSFAQFPGLEYLVGDQRSSVGWHDPDHLANRYTPHPYKVTQPIMLVGDGDDTVGLIWDPRAKWDGVHEAVQPLFASPNFLEEQENHRMGLFVPTAPEWMDENALVAEQPLYLKASQTVTVGAEIFVEKGLTPYTAAAQWIRMKSLPKMPAAPMSMEKALRFCVESEMETLWVPEAKGWRAHLPTSFEGLSDPHPNVTIARQLWAYSVWGADAALRDKIRAQCNEAMAKPMQGSSLGIEHLEYSFYTGQTAHALQAARRGIQPTLKSQKADGSWRFEYSEDRFKEMGESGDVAIGTCASRAEELLHFALITSDPEAEAAGLRALEFMNTLTRPEGAQTWEVPLHVPDVVAAGHAIDAYLLGYQITGDSKYLSRAVDFGYSGIPFAYTWDAPNRPIMRYGTIPVLGTSWHALPWYGLIVQWCGLVHTEAILELAKHDQSFPWRKFAEGELICGLQLQEKPGTPMQGTYPDVLSAVTGKEPFPVPYIYPHLQMGCLFDLLGMPGSPETTLVRDANGRVSVTSGAKMAKCRLEHSGNKQILSFELSAPTGEASMTLVTRHYASVSKDNSALPLVDDLSKVEEGVQSVPEGLLIKLRHGARSVRVSLTNTDN